MTVELQPETERLVKEEIDSGHFQSIDELIVPGVHALRGQDRFKPKIRKTSAEAIAHIR